MKVLFTTTTISARAREPLSGKMIFYTFLSDILEVILCYYCASCTSGIQRATGGLGGATAVHFGRSFPTLSCTVPFVWCLVGLCEPKRWHLHSSPPGKGYAVLFSGFSLFCL